MYLSWKLISATNVEVHPALPKDLCQSYSSNKSGKEMTLVIDSKERPSRKLLRLINQIAKKQGIEKQLVGTVSHASKVWVVCKENYIATTHAAHF